MANYRKLEMEKNVLLMYKFKYIMKKMKKTLSMIIVCFVLLLGNSYCRHETLSDTGKGNKLVPVLSNKKTASEYVLVTNLGHDAKGCSGCILNRGKYIHVDCQGYGTACSTIATVSLNTIGSSLTATTMDTFGLTNLDFFAMPDRSLDYMDENNNKIYLNIPAQTVYRDSTTLQFTFTGLYFSTAPAYNND